MMCPVAPASVSRGVMGKGREAGESGGHMYSKGITQPMLPVCGPYSHMQVIRYMTCMWFFLCSKL